MFGFSISAQRAKIFVKLVEEVVGMLLMFFIIVIIINFVMTEYKMKMDQSILHPSLGTFLHLHH